MTKWKINLNKYIWIKIVFIAYGIVYSFSLTFVYIEGDDAASVAYHAMGRNAELQKPYSAYHALMDAILRLFPSDPQTLLTVGMTITSAATVIMVVLILRLAFELTNITQHYQRALSAIVVLLAIPEFFYLGLLYTPSMFAMMFVVAAHLLVRLGLKNRSQPSASKMILASSILFAVGAAARWDIVTYGGVIAVDIMRNKDDQFPSRKESIVFGVIWGIPTLVLWFMTLFLLGFSPQDVFDVGESGADWIVPLSPLTFARIQTLASPATLLLVGSGLIAVLRRRDTLLIVAVLSLAIVFPWLTMGVPKMLLPAIPIIVTFVLIGLDLLSKLVSPSRLWSWSFALVLAGVLVAPWLVGVRYATSDAGWGPGFELRPFNDFSNTSFSVHLGGGASIPSPEGQRPLLGHIYVFSGQWRSFVKDFYKEQEYAVGVSIKRNLPIVLERVNPIVVTFLEQGFSTEDDYTRSIDDFVIERRYSDNNKTINIRLM